MIKTDIIQKSTKYFTMKGLKIVKKYFIISLFLFNFAINSMQFAAKLSNPSKSNPSPTTSPAATTTSKLTLKELAEQFKKNVKK